MRAAKAITVLVMNGHVAIVRVGLGDEDDLGYRLVFEICIAVGSSMVSESLVTTLDRVGNIIGKLIKLHLNRNTVVALTSVVG
mmetsp:Transcript_37883/g.77101  ORF Transcript_37883/g.77101 Transcript_37883/m.77101 type:complete len:83 (-) Transcript_37883:2116-2364(-)